MCFARQNTTCKGFALDPAGALPLHPTKDYRPLESRNIMPFYNITYLITTEYVKCLIKCHRKMLRNCASKWFNPLYCVFHNYHKYNHIHLSLCDIKANTKKIDVTYHHDSIGIFMQSVTFSHIDYTLRL